MTQIARLSELVIGSFEEFVADFNPGDTVTMTAGTGVVDIGLRKRRFELENGDRLVGANRDVEAKWTKEAE